MSPTRVLVLLAAGLMAGPAFGQGFNTPFHSPTPAPIPGANLLLPSPGPFTLPNTLLGELTGGRPYLGTPLIGGMYPAYYSGLYNGYFGGYPSPTLPAYSGSVAFPAPYATDYLVAPQAAATPGVMAYAAPTFASAAAVTAPPLEGAGATPAPIVPRLPAEFTVELPAEADVWVNGKKLDGRDKVRTLTSPNLDPGATHTFDVKAKWTANGQTYEWTRTVTLTSGERGRAVVASGFKVKD